MPLARLRVLALAIFACFANQALEARSLWAVDPSHTRITFVVDAVGWPQTEGRFTNFQGKIAIDFDNPHGSSVSFKVTANSVDIGSSPFNDFLRSEPFFNVAKYPYISYVSTLVEKVDAQHAHVTGNLTSASQG
jgi:polyisoprenoid-binding protein YceI